MMMVTKSNKMNFLCYIINTFWHREDSEFPIHMVHVQCHSYISVLKICNTQNLVLDPFTFHGLKRNLKDTVCSTTFHFSHTSSCSSSLISFLQNLVMFLSLVVAWVIPDVPKNIMEQLKREKKLLVDVFLQEEKEKFQLIQSLFSKDNPLQAGNHLLQQAQGFTAPERSSTLPSGQTQALVGDGGGAPRARCRAASFSQFTRKSPSSPMNENENSRHTAVWHTSVRLLQRGLSTVLLGWFGPCMSLPVSLASSCVWHGRTVFKKKSTHPNIEHEIWTHWSQCGWMCYCISTLVERMCCCLYSHRLFT